MCFQLMRLILKVFCLIALWGCTPSEPDWSAQFQADPQQVQKTLSQLPTQTERIAIIQQLQQAFPGQTSSLCTVLEGASQQYCLDRDGRPHLWMPLKETVELSTQTTVIESTCVSVACRIEGALQFANQGRLQAVEEACLLPTESEQHECLFATAEQLVAQKGLVKYDTAAEICRMARAYSSNCQQHLVQQLAKVAPDADSVSDWEQIHSAARAIETTWGWRDVTVQKDLQQKLWSEALGVSFAGADQIVGNVLDVVPVEYHCHVYSAATARLFQLQESSQHSLAEWAEELQQSFQVRNSIAERIDQQRKFRAAADLWKADRNDQTCLYLSTSRRSVSDDPVIDIQIAILEAIARRPPINVSLLQEALKHSNSLVQQTAIRLLEQVSPDAIEGED